MEKISYSLLKKLCSTSTEEMNHSFNVIFEKYRYLVYYCAFEILKDDEEAKDIVNDTFNKMYEKRTTFMSETKLKYFLLVTAKRLAINRYNQLKDRLSFCEELEGAYDDNGFALYLEKFKEILDELEYEYLVLHIVYEFTFDEIAKSNSKSTAQVSSKYRRGLEKLRNFYGGRQNELY